MTKKRGAMLNTVQAAQRAGVTASTWRKALSTARRERAEGRDRPGLVPEPDGALGPRAPWWHEATVDEYVASKPGRGARLDLRQA